MEIIGSNNLKIHKNDRMYMHAANTNMGATTESKIVQFWAWKKISFFSIGNQLFALSTAIKIILDSSGFFVFFRTVMKLRVSRKKKLMVLFLFYRMLGDSVIVKRFTTAHQKKNVLNIWKYRFRV